MGTFSASLKTLGDTRGLPATVNLEEDTLSITAGDQPIGSWSLAEINLEPTANGYRMAAEGEQIILEMQERDAFAEELSQRVAKGRQRLRRKEKVKVPKESRDAHVERPHTPVVYDVPVASAPAQVRLGPKETKEPKQPQPKKSKPAMERVDSALASAQKRWGSLFPDWVFTRIMFWIVVVAFLLMIIFPGAVSAFLLASGVLLVILGAIVYTDGVLASKWLPGRMTPTHVLIFGVAILMFGVLLGVIAR